jgi:L-alanine-DL-glutamate epimerase-like enolase superfamily enzyme
LHVWGSSLSLHSNAIFSLINNNIKLLEYPSVSFSLSDDIRQVKHKIKNGFLIFDNDFLGTGIEINKEIRNKYPFVKGSGYSINK